MVTFFRLTFSGMLWGGWNTSNKHHWCLWGVLTLSATLGLPLFMACVLPSLHCSGSRLLHQELSEASPGLHAPPRSKPLRFRHSGTPSSKAQTRLGLRFVPFPGLSSSDKKDKTYTCLSMMRCLASVIAATYRLPATWLSGCTTGAPSQVDVDRPESQEVLISNEACLQFCR